MAHLVLYHSVLGLRPVEHEIAAAFRADGHVVTLPDLYEGATAESYADGFAVQERVGDTLIRARARAALDAVPDDAVLGGVSFGAYLLGDLWHGRDAMPGALLIAGPAPWMEPRRPGLPVQAHVARPDPFDDEQVFEGWVAEAGGVTLDLFRYDGVGHYFLDRALPDYNRAAADLCLTRARAFLRSLDT